MLHTYTSRSAALQVEWDSVGETFATSLLHAQRPMSCLAYAQDNIQGNSMYGIKQRRGLWQWDIEGCAKLRWDNEGWSEMPPHHIYGFPEGGTWGDDDMLARDKALAWFHKCKNN